MVLDEILRSSSNPLFPDPETGWPILPSLMGTALGYWGTKDIIDLTTFEMIKKRFSGEG